MKLLFTQQDMPAARRRRMMAERAAEGEDAEAEDVPMVESIENLEDTRGRTVRESEEQSVCSSFCYIVIIVLYDKFCSLRLIIQYYYGK